jgi:hypothetical protein
VNCWNDGLQYRRKSDCAGDRSTEGVKRQKKKKTNLDLIQIHSSTEEGAHRCSVVESQGRGSLRFFFQGVLRVVRKSEGPFFRVLL